MEVKVLKSKEEAELSHFLVCTRVENHPIPPGDGATTDTCCECGELVWVAPTSPKEPKRICMTCVQVKLNDEDKETVFAIREGQEDSENTQKALRHLRLSASIGKLIPQVVMNEDNTSRDPEEAYLLMTCTVIGVMYFAIKAMELKPGDEKVTMFAQHFMGEIQKGIDKFLEDFHAGRGPDGAYTGLKN